MTSNPDDIRRDIERTRADLSHNVNALADQANPANIARRQVDKVTGGARDLKTRIFGDPHDPWDDGAVGDVQHRAAGAMEDARVAAAGAVGDAKDAVQDAPARSVGRPRATRSPRASSPSASAPSWVVSCRRRAPSRTGPPAPRTRPSPSSRRPRPWRRRRRST